MSVKFSLSPKIQLANSHSKELAQGLKPSVVVMTCSYTVLKGSFITINTGKKKE